MKTVHRGQNHQETSRAFQEFHAHTFTQTRANSLIQKALLILNLSRDMVKRNFTLLFDIESEVRSIHTLVRSITREELTVEANMLPPNQTA